MSKVLSCESQTQRQSLISEEKGERLESRNVSCWGCLHQIDFSDIFCRSCQALQPLDFQDAFSYLGVSRSYLVPQSQIDHRYLERQSQVHPDRFLKKSLQEQAYAMDHAIATNRAYEILGCPLKRAEHLLSLFAEEDFAKGSSGDMSLEDSDFLMEMLENQEHLTCATTSEEIDALASSNQRALTTCHHQLEHAFQEHAWHKARFYINRLTYYMRFSQEAQYKKTPSLHPSLNALS